MVIGGAATDGELRHDPALGSLVVLHDGIAIVGGLAFVAAHVLKQCIARGWAIEDRTSRLVEDGERLVYPLHILGVAHRAIGVRRRRVRAEGAAGPRETVAHAVKILHSRRCRRGARLGLQGRIRLSRAQRMGYVIDRFHVLTGLRRQGRDVAKRFGSLMLLQDNDVGWTSDLCNSYGKR